MEQITFNPEKVKIVPINEVYPNSWNPKDKDTSQYHQVVESLKNFGQRIPIVVREKPNGEGGLYEIIDGEQRWTGCKELEFEKVVVYNEGGLDDKTAQELTLWYEVHVPFNEVSLAKMVVNLTERFADAIVPFPTEKLEEFKELIKFDWDAYKNNVTPPSDAGPTMKTLVVPMTEEQFNIVQDAIAKVREEAQELTDGRCLELIAIEFINMPKGTTGIGQP